MRKEFAVVCHIYIAGGWTASLRSDRSAKSE